MTQPGRDEELKGTKSGRQGLRKHPPTGRDQFKEGRKIF